MNNENVLYRSGDLTRRYFDMSLTPNLATCLLSKLGETDRIKFMWPRESNPRDFRQNSEYNIFKYGTMETTYHDGQTWILYLVAITSLQTIVVPLRQLFLLVQSFPNFAENNTGQFTYHTHEKCFWNSFIKIT